MKRWARLNGGVVVNVVESDSDLAAPWVEVTGLFVGPGFVWNGTSYTPPTATVSLSPRAFLRRFTAAERETLEDLAATGTAGVKKKLAAFKTYLNTGGNVELNDDYIVAVVTAMETAGVIGAGRAAEILS